MNDQPTRVTPVDDEIARITWDRDLHEDGWMAAVDVVRREVARALQERPRVEALVPTDDELGQRVATWSGMRREGVRRGLEGDLIVYARLVTDTPVNEPGGFRALLNSFLPRKRAIGQLLIRDATEPEPRVLLCHLTYKTDWDLPGGVVEVGESPRAAVAREIEEELGLEIPVGPLLLTDWLPPWGGWDDAICLVFDGGAHDQSLTDGIVKQEREIAAAEFCTPAQVEERAADFTARRVAAALRNVGGNVGGRGRDAGPAYTESGR